MIPGNVVMDINSDLGESAESLASGADFELMRHITSANVACGGHAGDAGTMKQTVEFAKALNVSVGAHPSYPDRENFGRTRLSITPAQLEASIREQIAALATIAAGLGVKVKHVKPHGALYHEINLDLESALATGRAVLSIDPQLIAVGQAGSPCLEVWRAMGLRCAAEAFADRAYERDGTLRKRTLPGALLAAPEAAARQAVDAAIRRSIVAADGAQLQIEADTICVHSDTPGAPAIARAVRQALTAAGVLVQSL